MHLATGLGYRGGSWAIVRAGHVSGCQWSRVMVSFPICTSLDDGTAKKGLTFGRSTCVAPDTTDASARFFVSFLFFVLAARGPGLGFLCLCF